MLGHARRISIFAVVGVVNTAVDIAFFALFTSVFGMGLVPANVLAFLVAIANSYILNRAVTFSDRKASSRFAAGGVRFLGVGLFTLGLSSVIILALSPYIHPVMAKILASSTNLVVNYIGANIFVFPERKG
jgi:putative flippase GtrA